MELTDASSRIAAAFLRDTTCGHHGFELMRALDLPRTSVYQTLHLWSAAGILTSTYETAGAAPRRVFRLTPQGEERLRDVIFGQAGA